MKKLFSIMVWSVVFSVSVLAQAQFPRIIFSDLQSGPNSGGSIARAQLLQSMALVLAQAVALHR